jgi:hypothetical protein
MRRRGADDTDAAVAAAAASLAAVRQTAPKQRQRDEVGDSGTDTDADVDDRDVERRPDDDVPWALLLVAALALLLAGAGLLMYSVYGVDDAHSHGVSSHGHQHYGGPWCAT